MASYLRQSFKDVEVVINDLSGIYEEMWEIGEADVYGISVYVTTLGLTQKIARMCKEKNPNSVVVVGGAHPSCLPASPEFMDNPDIDLVVVGEGEIAISNIVRNRIKGRIVPSIDGKIIPVASETFDYFLFPSFDLIYVDSYHRRVNGEKSLPLLTTRGCPFKCFPKGTRVVTSDSINKNIEKIRVGDKLIAYDGGKLVETTVTKLFKHQSTELLEIEFENNGKIRCTPEHPFYVKGEWVEAKNLETGQEIYNINFKNKLSLQKKLYNPMKNESTRKKVSKKIKKLFIEDPDRGLAKCWKKYSKYEMHPKWVGDQEKFKEKNRNASKRMTSNNPMKNPEVCKKSGDTHRKIYASGEVVPFFKQPKEKWHMKYVSTPEEWGAWKKRDSERLKKSNPSHNPETLKKILKSAGKHPNGEETLISKFIDKNFPGEYVFSGDGSVIIGYYNPDFINVNGKKKLIEYNGCWYHHCKICFPNSKVDKRHEHRIKSYQKYGFEVLTIFSHEMKNPELLIKKIGDFTYNGLKIKSINKITNFDIVREFRDGKKPKTQVRIQKIPSVDVYNLECEPYHNYFVVPNHSKEYVLSHNCSFCGLQKMHELGRRVRFASPKVIYDQILKIKTEFGISAINFQDDQFTLNRPRLFEMLDMIKDLDIKFRCHGRAGYDNEEVYKRLAGAGCVQVAWGIESGSQYILDRMNKRVNVQDNYNVVEWAKKYGITSRAFIILFFPGETKETLEETKEFIKKADPDQVFVSSMACYPGTDVWNNPSKYGIISLDDDFSQYYQVGKDGMGPLLSFDTKWLNRHEAKELEIEFRKWVKNNIEFRGSLLDYEKTLYEKKGDNCGI